MFSTPQNDLLRNENKGKDAEIVAFRTCFLEKDRNLQEQEIEASKTAADLAKEKERNAELDAENAQVLSKYVVQ